MSLWNFETVCWPSPRRCAPMVTTCAALLLAALPPAAPAQSFITGTRADIAVTDIADATSYGPGPAGSGLQSVFAFDLGTISCSAGSENVLWEVNTPNHPVIAQNIYRVANGRIVQIGMSWVKHAFFALADEGCGLGCNGLGGAVLGVGCSDPYTLGVNGVQSALGPRSLINPATGVFEFNPASWPAVQNALSRRIQVHAADIDPSAFPSATYIGEAVYVAPDDALNSNAFNNAAWRPVAFAPPPSSVRTLSPVPGSTTRIARPAIFAWKETHPDVLIVPIDIPGDGQLFLASRASPLPDGRWRYEYALQNLSSHRGVRGLSIPAPPSGVSSPFFAAPRWHSGEAVANRPWTHAVGPLAASWSTDDPTQLADAPYLRWGTLHSFGFTAAALPTPTTATLTLALPAPPAGPGSGVVDIGGRVLAPSHIAPAALPLGDVCTQALPAHPGDNGASFAGATPSSAASPCGPDAAGPDLWWRYTFDDTCSGPLTISTCGSTFDTVLAVYDGASCQPLGTLLACSDDAPGSCATPVGIASSGSSRVSLFIDPGRTVLIRVLAKSTVGPGDHAVVTITPPRCAPPPTACCFPESGQCGIVGTAALCASRGGVWQGPGSTCTPNPCPQPARPENDLCANAIPLADTLLGGGLVLGSTINATTDAPPPCESGGRDVWYRYTPAISEPVTVDLCGTPSIDFADTVLQILSACGGTSIACNDDDCGGRSRVTVNAQAGVTYLIRVMGFAGTQGRFVIEVTGGGGTAVGACCRGVTCALLPAAACTGPGARFIDTALACNTPATPRSPCCRADFDQSGALGVQDIFGFLEAWFSGNSRADWVGNGAGAPGVESVFAFIAAWFAGC